MGLQQQLHYFEKQFLRPFFRRVGRLASIGGSSSEVPPRLQARLESLEARLTELEQLIQEDLGLRLSKQAPTHQSDGHS